jgi:hypothetical protein
VINFRSGVPLHRQVADLLRERIAQGDWAPGAYLPSEVDLAHEYSIGRDTLRQAYATLRAEGLLLPGGPGTRSRVAPAPDRHVVWLDRDADIVTRMPVGDEREVLGIPEGVVVPVFEVTVAGVVTMYPGDRVRLRTTRSGDGYANAVGEEWLRPGAEVDEVEPIE